MTKKQRKILYPIIFFLGNILMICQITIYRKTIIDLSILFKIIGFTGIIFYIIDIRNYIKTYDYGMIMSHIYGAMHYFLGIGFTVCALFMFTNYYIGDTSTTIETYEILDRSSMPGNKHNRIERQPLIRIRYQNKIKELVFSYKYYEMMEFYNTVELETRKGYLGYDIIENQTLK